MKRHVDALNTEAGPVEHADVVDDLRLEVELREAKREAAGLRTGLETRGRIGMALGIVMHRFGLDEDDAWAYLQRLSQHQNVNLRLIAEGVIAEHLAGLETLNASA